MPSQFKFAAAALKAFESTYDSFREDVASQVRGEFLRNFPKNSISNIKLTEYVIGLKRPTFCTYVEAKTRPWANIQGATAEKFGIYFGKIKSDPTKKYRFTHKFGRTRGEAFKAVRVALLDLVRLGDKSNPDFEQIDANPLSQMFKAKILSLYFPERFLNICAAEHLRMLGDIVGYGEGRWVSEYQHLLLKTKLLNPITREWSNPKFMTFLYDTYIRSGEKPTAAVRKPKKMAHRKVNFEDIQAQRSELGKKAEEFAMEWEKQRLVGADLSHLIPKIEDRRDCPGYGYDFLSHSSAKQQRFVEVKSVGKLPGGKGHRFFLSDNEHLVSISKEHRDEYYFYLVFFNGDGEPASLQPINAEELYEHSEMLPASYVVRFDLEGAPE